MARYIDAERFSERFDMMCDAGGVLAPVTKAVREMAKELIKAEPTADVQEVKHGRWGQLLSLHSYPRKEKAMELNELTRPRLTDDRTYQQVKDIAEGRVVVAKD